MTPQASTPTPAALRANWVANATLLWEQRRRILRITFVGAVISIIVAFVIPKRYEASARIMPPEQGGGGGAAMIAALVGRSGSGGGGLGSLASSLLGTHNTSALFVDLLRCGTISSHLIDRFQLQHAYRKRYKVDAAKYLARHTTVVDDKKSGVITITIEDASPQRARDIAQGYLDELNQIVTLTNTSSARQERTFIEKRLTSVQADLEHAQLALSDFSSSHTTIDIKEQTRAMVDAAARLQGQLIVSQSELGSLQQIYGNGNVRVRAAQARVGALQHELTQMSGTDAALPANVPQTDSKELYPPLRQLPRLAVPYADLYRRVRVQETVFELLTQEYEMARIQEAKDTPVISIIDLPGVPEKKSFPPRTLVVLILTLLSLVAACAWFLVRERWDATSEADPRKILLRTIQASLPARLQSELRPKPAPVEVKA
ncbi:MAG: lipopolysaccharide biosynthesis protein [Acidobacteriaceae bacterium]|nr:lipopolysaccharide biosynthesis protein [Acidobacteriaceae bacterium]